MRTRSVCWLPVASFLCFSASRVGAVNRVFIDDQTVHVGQTGVEVPVRLDSDQWTYGFSLSILTDARVIRIAGLEIAGTVADGAEFSAGHIRDGGARISWGVVLDISAPFDLNRVVPAGPGLTIARLMIDVAASDDASAALRFQDVPSDHARNVLVSREGSSILLASSPGTITVANRAPSAFLRGDADGDGRVNIADAVHTLSYQFAHGAPSRCLDAADASDDGKVNIADAVAVLSHLLDRAGPLPEPFAACGNDPTIDEVDCQEHAPCRQ